MIIGKGFRDEKVSVPSLRGIRAWKFEPASGLNNHTSCIRGLWNQRWDLKKQVHESKCFSADRIRWDWVSKKPSIEPCSGIAVDCVCGFYAYFSSEMNNLEIYFPVSVIGVIEGFGKMTIGEKGFRCEYAKVLALCALRIGDVLGKFHQIGGWMNVSSAIWSGWDRLYTPRVWEVEEDLVSGTGIPVFRSVRDMITEFPLSKVEDCYPI